MPVKLPDMNPEILAKLVFCFENDPERNDGIVSGAQDSIGICMPGLVRHYYDNRFWPDKFETCLDEKVLSWLESHVCMIPMDPRRPGCSVVEGKDITEPKVKNLAKQPMTVGMLSSQWILQPLHLPSRILRCSGSHVPSHDSGLRTGLHR